MLQGLKQLPDSNYYLDKEGNMYLIRKLQLDKQGRYTVKRKIGFIRIVHYTPEKVKYLYGKLEGDE